MKTLHVFICLLLATVVNAAVPDYKAFVGIGGIVVSSNPPNGTIVIDGSGISAGSLPAFSITNRYSATFTNLGTLRQIGAIHIGSGIVSNAFLYLNGSSNVAGGSFSSDFIFSGGVVSSGMIVSNANILYVDVNGNNTTAKRGRPDKPYREVTNAVNDHVEGDTIYVGGGLWTNNYPIVLKTGAKLIGRGRGVTYLTNTCDLATLGTGIVLGTNTVVANMTLQTAYFPDEVLRANIGNADVGPGATRGFQNAYLYGLECIGESDNVFLQNTNPSSFRAYNCTFFAVEDMLVQALTNGHRTEFYDCDWKNVSTIAGVGDYTPMGLSAGYAAFIRNSITVSNGVSHEGIHTEAGTVLELIDTSFYLELPSDIHVQNAGTVYIDKPANADPYRLAGAGTYVFRQKSSIQPAGGTNRILGLTHFGDGRASNSIPWINAGTNLSTLTIGSGLSLTAGTLSATGGAGTPAGSTADVQFNEGGAFAGTNRWRYIRVDNMLQIIGTGASESNQTRAKIILTNDSLTGIEFNASGVSLPQSQTFQISSGPAGAGWGTNIFLFSASSFRPAISDSMELGISANRWEALWVNRLSSLGSIYATGYVHAAGAIVGQSFSATNDSPGSSTAFVNIPATNLTQSVRFQGAHQMSKSVTNIVGLLEVGTNAIASQVFTVDCNQIHRVNMTNRIGFAFTAMITNGAPGQVISGRFLGTVSGGANHVITFAGPGLFLHGVDMSVAPAHSIAVTITNGYLLEYNIAVNQDNGTNTYDTVYAYKKL